jgi:hypothetical protein
MTGAWDGRIIGEFEGVPIARADDEDAARWDAALLDIAGGAVFATWAWRNVLRRHFSVAPVYLCALSADGAGAIAGALPLYANRDASGVRHLYGARQGLIASDAQVAAALVAAAREEARVANCASLALSARGETLDTFPGSARRATFHLELNSDEETMWRGLRDKTRNMVRRARRNGVTVREVPHEAPAFDLLARHNRENLLPKGVAVPGPGYFAAVCASHAEHAHILAAFHEDTPIASMLVLRHGDHAAYPVQNVTPAHRKLAPIQLLSWEAMCLSAAKGSTYLDMGESREGSQVYQSKKHFGGIPEPLSILNEQLASASGLARYRSVLDTLVMQHVPLAVRGHYARWRYSRGRIL